MNLFCIIFTAAYAAHNIMDYGATPGPSDYNTAKANAVAFQMAFGYAVKDPSDNEVEVPAE
jgi:hypothetical protein